MDECQINYGYWERPLKKATCCMIPFTWHSGKGNTSEENRSVRGWEVGLNTKRYGRIGGNIGMVLYLYLIGVHLSNSQNCALNGKNCTAGNFYLTFLNFKKASLFAFLYFILFPRVGDAATNISNAKGKN